MKTSEEFVKEMIDTMTAEVIGQLPTTVHEMIATHRLPFTDNVAEAMIDMYTEGLKTGLSKALRAVEFGLLYKATSQLLKGDDEK